MEENKNIDKFFKDRLETDNAPEWATPSDDIWMNAKSRFNNKKKRRFIFWMLGSGFVVLGLVSFIAIIYNQKNENVERKQFTDKVEQVDNKQLENSEIGEVNTVDVSNFISKNERAIANQSKGIKSKKLVNDKSDRKKITDLNIYKKEGKLTKLVVDNGIETSDRSIKNASQTLDEYEAKSQELFTNQTIRGNLVHDEGSTKIIIPTELNSDPAIADKTLPTLEVLPRQKSILKFSSIKIDMSGLNVAVSPLILEGPNYELGLSHSKYLINAFLEEGLTEGDEADLNNVDLSIKNINITGRKWINRKWSISIGTNLTKLNINADIELLDTLDKDLNNFINDNYTISRSNLTSDIPDIGLIDGIELMNGDIVNVKGNVDLSLLAIQLPIMLDYHIYKNKMEYLFGSGFSVDFIQAAQGEIDISIFKDQQLVNKPFVQERVTEFIFDYSLYANLGMKYHIHKNWNVGLSMKISVLDPVFSYAELGIYYRWHK